VRANPSIFASSSLTAFFPDLPVIVVPLLGRHFDTQMFWVRAPSSLQCHTHLHLYHGSRMFCTNFAVLVMRGDLWVNRCVEWLVLVVLAEWSHFFEFKLCVFTGSFNNQPVQKGTQRHMGRLTFAFYRGALGTYQQQYYKPFLFCVDAVQNESYSSFRIWRCNLTPFRRVNVWTCERVNVWTCELYI
jgi:hypothetical protein